MLYEVITTSNEGIEDLKNGVNELFQVVSDKVDGNLNSTYFSTVEFTLGINQET